MAHTNEGLAALCLLANGFKAEGFVDARLRDGRIANIASSYEAGRFVCRIFAGGASEYYAKGASTVSEADARAQAEMIFAAHEVQKPITPGDLVQIEAPCF